jgi:hypothetical protein
MRYDVRCKKLAQNFVKKHGGCFLHVVAACMEQRVHGEVGTALQVIAVTAPGHRLPIHHAEVSLGIQPDTHRCFLFERMKVSLETLVTHQLAGIFLESYR